MTSIVRPTLPPVLRAAIDAISSRLPEFITDAVYEQDNRERGMRRTYQAQLQRVITWLLLHMDIPSRKILTKLGSRTFISATLEEIAGKLGVSTKTIQRVFSFFGEIGLIESEKQPRQRFVDANGTVRLMCGVTCRRISILLFEKLGLRSLYEENRRKAAQNQRLIAHRFRFVKAVRAKKPSSQSEASSPWSGREALYMRVADMVAEGRCSISELQNLKIQMGR